MTYTLLHVRFSGLVLMLQPAALTCNQTICAWCSNRSSATGKVSIGYGRLSADANDSDASAWALAYFHSLSKRTTLYAGYGNISNNDAQSVRSPAFVSAANTAAGDSSSS